MFHKICLKRCACPVCVIIFVATLLLPSLLQTAWAEKQCAEGSPAAILLNAEDPQHEAMLISSDIVLFAATLAEKKAIDGIVTSTLEKTQTALIAEFLKTLEERLYAWRNSDELLNAALGNLISEFAVMQRFYAAKNEYKLFYEKSVQIRMSSFENRRQNAGLERSDFLADLLPWESAAAGELARLYSNENPLQFDKESDRVALMLILHLLQSSPSLRKIWSDYTSEAKLLLGDDFSQWNAVQDAASGIALGRDSDLCDENNRIAFRDGLRRLLGDFEKQPGSVDAYSIPLLAMRSADIRRKISHNEPAEKQIVRNSNTKTSIRPGSENVAMSLFCVEHGKPGKTAVNASCADMKEAYLEISRETYLDLAASLRKKSENIALLEKDSAVISAGIAALAAEIEKIAAIESIAGDGAVQIAKAPPSLLESAWLKSAISVAASDFRCIFGTSREDEKLLVNSGAALWQQQKIDYLLPLEEAPVLEGNAMLDEAPALVIPDSRHLMTLLTTRLAYRRLLEKFRFDGSSQEDSWSEFPLGKPETKIPLPQ